MTEKDNPHPFGSLENVRELLVLVLQEIEYLILSDLKKEDERMQERIRDKGYYHDENCETCPYAPIDPVDEER